MVRTPPVAEHAAFAGEHEVLMFQRVPEQRLTALKP
jgi:hypothetical protein